jgi:hypothetical protein
VPSSSRVVDITLATAVLTFWSPLMVVLALSLVIQSAGPILQRGNHITSDGRRVTSIRFRSQSSRVWGAVVAAGLDTLPQYFDVILGRLRLADVEVGHLPQEH